MLNRRQLLSSLAALGLVAATPDPVRRYWALDQTMVPQDYWESGRFNAEMASFDKIMAPEGSMMWWEPPTRQERYASF